MDVNVIQTVEGYTVEIVEEVIHVNLSPISGPPGPGPDVTIITFTIPTMILQIGSGYIGDHLATGLVLGSDHRLVLNTDLSSFTYLSINEKCIANNKVRVMITNESGEEMTLPNIEYKIYIYT